ncbi:MAG: MFS transporter [Actinomycetota bacterium]
MSSTRTRLGRVGILQPLSIRDFAWLWTGMTVSMVGDGIYIVAIAWQVYQLKNTPTALAAVGIAWSLPQLFLLVGSGVLSDRLDRRHLMIAGDILRLLAIGTVGVLSLVDELTIPRLIGLVVVYGVGQALFFPAFSSIVPSIVPAELLVEANSLGQFVRPFAMTLVGPLVGGLLVGGAGAGWAFIADGLTFAFSAVMITLIRARPTERDAADSSSFWSDTKEGIRYVRERAWLWVALIGAFVSLLCTWGPWETLVPFIVKNALHGSAIDLGLVFGAGGVGSVLAALIFGQRGGLPRRPLTTLYLFWALGMLMTTGFGVVNAVWQAMIVAFVAEGSITVLVVVWVTLLQRLVAPDLLGRVSSLDWMVSIGGVPISFAIVGPLAATFGAQTTMIWAGLLGAAVTIGFMFVPGARGPERDGSLAPEASIGSSGERR